MKLLIIGFSDSIHVVKWVNNIINDNFEIILYPSIDNGKSHKELKNLTLYHSFYCLSENSKNINIKGVALKSPLLARILRKLLNKFFPNYHIYKLKKIIKKNKPDLIHSLEFQHSSYLILKVKKIFKDFFPKWLVTNYGSDIFFFQKFKDHRKLIKEVLINCDYYACECKRDIMLAKKYGFRGICFKMKTNTSGFDNNILNIFENSKKSSERKYIMLKGYQGLFGRALNALSALELLSKYLYDFTILLYSAEYFEDVKEKVQQLIMLKNLNIKIIPNNVKNIEILKYHSLSRISISINISDGVSTSLLEAMAMGSFPIQSSASCAEEWIINGKTGFLVNPNNIEEIKKAIKTALVNDVLIDEAAILNHIKIRNDLNFESFKKDVLNLYNSIMQQNNF